MKLSIIIPTYKRPDLALQALGSLQEQTLQGFEAIVVDNAADPALRDAVEDFNRTARVKALYVAEPELGLHNARHAGVRAASGDVVVFTDDDATFDADWLESYVRAFEAHPEMAAAGGPVRPVWEAEPSEWLFLFRGSPKMFSLLSLMELYEEFRLDPKGIFFGVNMAIRRDVLFSLGGFNPECFGETWLGDGETGLNYMLWERGMQVGYAPDALVYHHIPLHRMTLEYFCHRMANQGNCDSYTDYRRHLYSPAKLYGKIFQHVKNMLLHAACTALKFAFLRGSWRVDRARVSYFMNRIKYDYRLIHDRGWREMVLRRDWINTS